jgi:hypothetical protein
VPHHLPKENLLKKNQIIVDMIRLVNRDLLWEESRIFFVTLILCLVGGVVWLNLGH